MSSCSKAINRGLPESYVLYQVGGVCSLACWFCSCHKLFSITTTSKCCIVLTLSTLACEFLLRPIVHILTSNMSSERRVHSTLLCHRSGFDICSATHVSQFVSRGPLRQAVDPPPFFCSLASCVLPLLAAIQGPSSWHMFMAL